MISSIGWSDLKSLFSLAGAVWSASGGPVPVDRSAGGARNWGRGRGRIWGSASTLSLTLFHGQEAVAVALATTIPEVGAGPLGVVEVEA